jgi:hypothetical protein
MWAKLFKKVMQSGLNADVMAGTCEGARRPKVKGTGMS